MPQQRTTELKMQSQARDAETIRLAEDASRQHNWKRWGPYLAERQWGTVREDYSVNGDCWNYFPHDHARSRAYRWGEDGLMGICDREGRLCFAVALWNGRDPILKERLFGLTNPQGNHGEDVKECYFYLDSSPTHSYMKGLYKYSQREFPYQQLVEENGHRSGADPEFELIETGTFDDDRYFDVQVEYAKAGPDDILIRITASNRGPDAAQLHVLPTLWFRNTWSWGRTSEGYWRRPMIRRLDASTLTAQHESFGTFRLDVEPLRGAKPEFLFTENETNVARLFGGHNPTPYVKDAFHERVIHHRLDAVNPNHHGTKAAAQYRLDVPAGGQTTIRLRLTAERDVPADASWQPFGEEFDRIFASRIAETNEFYSHHLPQGATEEQNNIMRQAYAGLLWSKQFFHYIVEHWLEGDPSQPKPPGERLNGRNCDWTHLFNRDVISMPDKWEYPWYAAWDLAFHMIPFAKIDPDFAKQQLLLMLREWYMHPNGQIPAYEFALGDVNPPVHAWACWRVYKMTGDKGGGKGRDHGRGRRDREFLARAFQKLMINFTWWVNRKDVDGKHIFSGGFLGLDNIGVFDRSAMLPSGAHLEQADGTAWMACYCLTMLAMAIELASEDPAYEDVASKFFEHFVHIADAMNTLGGSGLWDEHDGFYYDQLHLHGSTIPLKVRSMVGLIPLFAVEVLEEDLIERLPGFAKRMRWFLENRTDLARHISYYEAMKDGDARGRHLLAIPSRPRLERVIRRLLDESEFLSDFGVRALSRIHQSQPYTLSADGRSLRVEYVPGESNTGLFGGNSNWRGPVWFPVNYLLIESLERYHHFYGERLRVECPARSGCMMNLQQVAQELRRRLGRIFLPDQHGARPVHGEDMRFATDPHWRDLVLFYEYFHGDNGRGVGASHQTGWTALVAPCLEDLAAHPGAASAAPSGAARESQRSRRSSGTVA